MMKWAVTVRTCRAAAFAQRRIRHARSNPNSFSRLARRSYGTSSPPRFFEHNNASTSDILTASNGNGNVRSAAVQAHRLLEEFNADNFKFERWMEAEDCLWKLSSIRTVDSVDLSLLFLDRLVAEKVRLLKETSAGNQPARSELIAHTRFLRNWDLWHSILLNWQHVSREELAKRDSMRNDMRVTSPQNLLALLDSWSKTVTEQEGSFTTFATSKALSYMIDVTGRRGAVLSNDFKALPLTCNGSSEISTPEILEAAEFAEMLLFRMISLDDETDKSSFPPSTGNLNACLLLWSKAGRVDRAWSVLKRSLKKVQPDMRSYNSILLAYAAMNNGMEAESVLHELCRTSSSESIQVKPDVTSWNIVLKAWASSRDKKLAAERVQQLLLSMMMSHSQESDTDLAEQYEMYRDSEHNGSQSQLMPVSVKPNLTTFNTALSAWARVGEADTCERMLEEMKEWHASGRLEDAPDSFSYATVMNAFAKAGRPDKAELLSDEMYKEFMENGNVQLKPNITGQTCVLEAYSRSILDATRKKNDSQAIECLQRAKKVFQRMRDLHQFGFLAHGPDTTAFNVMLICYLRSCVVDTFPSVNTSAEQADRLLAEMKRAEKRDNAAPTFASYSMVIQAWLHRPDGGERALALLNEVWDKHRKGDSYLKPDPLSLHCIVVGFCRAGRPDIGHNLLTEICKAKERDATSGIEPKVASFGSVVGAWSRSDKQKAAKLALDLVERMEGLHRSGLLKDGPDHIIYRTLISALSHSKQLGAAAKAHAIISKMRGLVSKGDRSMQPDLQSYNQVLFAYSCGKPDPLQAETLLTQMYDDYQKGVATKTKPDIRSFVTTLSAWARSNHPESVGRATKLFREMQRLHAKNELDMNIFAYNCMLNCFASTSTKEGAESAALMIQSMVDQSDENLQPDGVSYSCLMKAYAAIKEAEKVEEVLFRMVQDFSKGSVRVKPRPLHFDQVARAWSESEDPAASDRADSLFQEMQRLQATGLDIDMEVTAFNTVLDCLASTRNQDSAERIEEMLQSMHDQTDENLKPDGESYSCLIRAWALIGEAEKSEAVLTMMTEEFFKGTARMKPEPAHFEQVAKAWSSSLNPESIDKAEAFFREMLLLKNHGLDIPIFALNTILDAFASLSSIEGAARVESMIRSMSQHSDDTLKPNSHSYDCLINAWTSAGEATRAEAVLSEMIKEFSNGNAQMKPLPRHFERVEMFLSEGSSHADKLRDLRDVRQQLYP